MPWEISYYQTPHNSQAQPFTYAALTQIVKLTPFLSGEAIIRPYLGVSMYDVSSSTFTSVDGIYIKEV